MPEPVSQYLVGIDLGTTNTVVAYTPVAQPPGRGKRRALPRGRLFLILPYHAPLLTSSRQRP